MANSLFNAGVFDDSPRRISFQLKSELIELSRFNLGIDSCGPCCSLSDLIVSFKESILMLRFDLSCMYTDCKRSSFSLTTCMSLSLSLIDSCNSFTCSCNLFFSSCRILISLDCDCKAPLALIKSLLNLCFARLATSNAEFNVSTFKERLDSINFQFSCEDKYSFCKT